MALHRVHGPDPGRNSREKQIIKKVLKNIRPKDFPNLVFMCQNCEKFYALQKFSGTSRDVISELKEQIGLNYSKCC